MFSENNNENKDIIDNVESNDSNLFGIEDDEKEIHEEGKATKPLPEINEPSEFDQLIDSINGNKNELIDDSNVNLTEKEKKKIEKKNKKDAKKKQKIEEQIALAKQEDSVDELVVGLSESQEKKVQNINKKIDNNLLKNENDNQEFYGELPRPGLNYVDAYDVDLNSITPFSFKKNKNHKNSDLFINTKIYNRFMEYLPSDFSPAQIRDLFVDLNLMHLPNNSGFRLKLFPNDNERSMRVEVYVNRFYSDGQIIEKRKVFSPFWITGFGESVLYATTFRPIEKNYRVNNINTFAYRETTKILNKKISAKYISLSRDKFATEQDFQQAQALKNSYIKHHIDRLNMINTVEWECVPDLFVDWRNKRVCIKLYLKIISTIDYSRLPHMLYVDSFNVNLNNLLDIKKQNVSSFDENISNKNQNRKLIDINTIMYLIALNAMYKNIQIFSYNTLYECYKSISYQILEKGYDLKPITPSNLSTLKIVDFSKHFCCTKKMFDDRLLHLMNLKSSNEEYYRMKYMYTVQKNPKLLYSEFIVKEFEKVSVNDLALLLRNEEEKIWRKRINDLKTSHVSTTNFDKDFYINNYNIFDYSKNEFNNVEEYLMNVIKENKDEISRISALGREILSVDQKNNFTRRELRELQKTSRKLNRIEIK